MNDEPHSRDYERLEPPLDAAVQATLAEPLPEDAVERVKTRARQLAATNTSPRRIADSRRRGWRISRSVVASLAIAAALLAMVTGLALLLDRSGGRVFAQMIEKVKAANSVRFSATYKFGQQPEMDGTGQVYLEGNRSRFEQFGGSLVSIADADRQQILTLFMQRKQFQRSHIGADMARELANPIDKLRRAESDDADSIGEDILNGRRTRVYRLSKVDLLGIQGNDEMMVWVDVESELPAKIVIRDADPKHQIEEVRFENFVWNEPLDPKLLSLEVPEGFEPDVVSTWMAEPTELPGEPDQPAAGTR